MLVTSAFRRLKQEDQECKADSETKKEGNSVSGVHPRRKQGRVSVQGPLRPLLRMPTASQPVDLIDTQHCEEHGCSKQAGL